MNKWNRDKSYVFNTEISSDDQHIKEYSTNLYDKYITDFPRVYKKDKILNFFYIICMNLVYSNATNKTIAISRNRANYNKLSILNHDQTIKILDWLIDNHIINQIDGSYGLGYITRIYPSEYFIDTIHNSTTPTLNLNNIELIVLRGKNGEDILFKDNKNISDTRELLIRYNTLLNESDIGFQEIKLRRIFSRGSFSEGGRFYPKSADGEHWLNIRTAQRKQIRINGNATVEPDYSSHHANICRLIKGLDISKNCYEVCIGDIEVPKGLSKVIFNICLNSDSKVNANRAARFFIKENYAKYKEWMKYVDDIIFELEYKNKEIKEYMFKSKGTKLQYIDSVITYMILEHFTNRGILVLPVHDSYIIEEQYETELKIKMLEYRTQVTKEIK